MRIMREEVFAPLLPIMAVCNMDEAIALANDTPYGLSASIWTRNRRQAWRWAEQFHTGGVAINDCLVHFGITEIPFGGVRQSGFGRVGGREGLWELFRYPVGGGAPLWHAASVSLVPLPRQAPLDGPHCPLDVRLPIFAALAGINAAAKPRPPTRREFACRTTGICRRPNASTAR